MKKLSHKFILLSLTACLILGVVINGMAYYYMDKAKKSTMENLDNSLQQRFDQLIKSEVQTAITMLEQYHKSVENGEMTKEVAMKEAAAALRSLRFGEDGYFWADTYDGTNVVLLGKDTEGTNRNASVDANGVLFIQKIIEAGRKGGGFTDYHFPKNGGTEALPKRSYSQAFEPFGWVIGTGNYTDDISKVVAAEEEKMSAEFDRNITVLTLISMAIVLLVIIVTILFSVRITKPLQRTTQYLNRLAEGDFTAEMSALDQNGKDEIGTLIRSAQTMRDAITLMVRSIIHESGRVNQILNRTIREMEALNEQVQDISATTQELSAGMEETAASSEQMNSSSLEIKKAVEQIATKGSEATKASVEIDHRAKALQEGAVQSQTTAEVLYQETNRKLRTAIDRAKAVEEIEQLSAAILEIASRTNLLSLNASIEAARAGEYGKGFAVVAGEIREMAENSKKSANDIQHVARAVIEAVQNLSDSSEEVLHFIEKQVIQDYQNQIHMAQKYSEDAEFVKKLMAYFGETSEHLHGSVEFISRSINEISLAAVEGAVGTTSIAEKSTVIVQNAENVTMLSKEAMESSTHLMQAVSKFKLE